MRLIHLSGENDVITAVRRWHGLTGGGGKEGGSPSPEALRNAALWHRGPCGSEGSVLCCLPPSPPIAFTKALRQPLSAQSCDASPF